MSYIEFTRRTLTAVLIVAAVAVGLIALWTLRSILLIGFTCWVLSVALSIPIAKLEHRGMQRGYAVLLTLIGTLLTFLLVVFLVFPPLIAQVVDLIQGLPQAAEDAVQGYDSFRADDDKLKRFLPEFTIEDYNDLLEGDTNTPLSPDFDWTSLARSTLPILGGVGNFLGDVFANLFIIVIITIYLLLDPMSYYRGILAVVPQHRETRVLEIINELRRVVAAWLSALAVSVSATAVMVASAMGLILGVPNAIALGVIAGLGTVIPYLGYYIALIPILVFTGADDPAKLPFAFMLYVIIGEIESKAITPQVVKSELNIPAGMVLLFQLIAASQLGFFGILLAVPILAISIALIRELYVYDVLHKKGRIPQIVGGPKGILQLAEPSQTTPSAKSAAKAKPSNTNRKTPKRHT
ncbi:MAG: AI-2E family transporter [Anaerolineales bacterium]|nr:AI-2E family transporter [Anaerolineales bacterium]